MATDSDELLSDRARDAKRLLENPMVIEAFETLESTIIAKWRASPEPDSEGRERAWRQLHILAEFRRFFELALASGRTDLLMAEYRKNEESLSAG